MGQYYWNTSILIIVSISIPSDPVTQTLISFTLTCKLTHLPAQWLLFRHSLYIDLKDQLDSLLEKSSYFLNNDNNGLNQCMQASSLFLAPFPETLNEPRTVNQIDHLFAHICSTLRNLVINMPLCYIHLSDDAQGLCKPL